MTKSDSTTVHPSASTSTEATQVTEATQETETTAPETAADTASDVEIQETAGATTAAHVGRVQRSRLLLGLAGLLAVLLIAGGLIWWYIPPELHGVVLQSPRQVEDFTLTASTGEPLSLSDLRGQWVMLFFGYTHCPDVCPTTLNDLTIMADELGENRMDDVQVVLVSVDPERDTVERLADYLPSFDPRFVGMTGDLEKIQDVAGRFGVFFEKHENGLVDHTSAITVIDPDGYVRIVFPYGITGSEMADDLSYLMRRG